MSDHNPPDYEELERALRALEAMGAAEAHGVIAGVLSGPRPNNEAWAAAVLADVLPAADRAGAEHLLGDLRAETEKQLTARESDFSPLLPHEDSTLPARVGALADFCRGYVLGLVAGGVRDLGQLPHDAREVVDDFMKIAEAETESVATEVEEQALAELVEYVRVGVQLVYEALHTDDASGVRSH